MAFYGATESVDTLNKTRSCSFTDCLTRFVFLFIFMAATFPAWLYTLIGDIYWNGFGWLCCYRSDSEWRRRRGRIVGYLVAACWRCAFAICSCWLRIDWEGAAALEEAGKSGRPVFLAVNHASFLDIPVACVAMPWRLAGDGKTLMAHGHLRLPFLGRLAEAVGHMPVPFKNTSTRGDFSVDKEKMASIMTQVDDHIRAGGHLGVFPEGDLNKDWKNLQRFRAGGLEVAIRHDMEVWALVIAGTADSWPEGEMVGGSPAQIRMCAKLLHSSASESAKHLAVPEAGIRAHAEALADDMHTSMQQMLNSVLVNSSEPWAWEDS